MDLGFKGPRYTWSNCRSGKELTKERLDRAIANAEWCSLYNVIEVNVLTRTASDHHPILLSCHNNREVKWVKNKSFRYEVGWSNEKEHGVLIKKAGLEGQLQGDHWGRVQGGLNKCKRTLKLWVRMNVVNQGERSVSKTTRHPNGGLEG
jgi:hypothetical protein